MTTKVVDSNNKIGDNAIRNEQNRGQERFKRSGLYVGMGLKLSTGCRAFWEVLT